MVGFHLSEESPAGQGMFGQGMFGQGMFGQGMFGQGTADRNTLDPSAPGHYIVDTVPSTVAARVPCFAVPH